MLWSSGKTLVRSRRATGNDSPSSASEPRCSLSVSAAGPCVDSGCGVGVSLSPECFGDVSVPAWHPAASASPGSWLSSGSAEPRLCIPGSHRPAKSVPFHGCALQVPIAQRSLSPRGLGSKPAAALWERSPGVCLPAMLWTMCCLFGCACVRVCTPVCAEGVCAQSWALSLRPPTPCLLVCLSVQTGCPVRMCAHMRIHV